MLTLGLKGLMYMSRSERAQKFPIFIFVILYSAGRN